MERSIPKRLGGGIGAVRGRRAQPGRPCLILSLERRLGVIKRVRVPVTLTTRQLEAHAPESWTVQHIRHPIEAPDVALAVEHIVVFVLPVAAGSGSRTCAAGDNKWNASTMPACGKKLKVTDYNS